MRAGGIRPLPPLGGRMGSSRGLGEARGAPPPLRGAQRDMGRDRYSTPSDSTILYLVGEAGTI